MAAPDLATLFDTFTVSAFRLETRAGYLIDSEAERIEAFRLGLPRPERSPRTSPWLARIQATSRAGRRWDRVRVMDDPPTFYQRYQIDGYREAQAAGDHVRITRRRDVPGLDRDWWLFDDRAAAFLVYDDEGRFLRSYSDDSPELITRLRQDRDAALAASVELGAYLAEHEAA